MKIEDADDVRVGAVAADRVMAGSGEVWSAVPPWSPATVPGLVAWLDAAQDSFAEGEAIYYYTEHSPVHRVFQAQSGQAVYYRGSVGGKPRLHFIGSSAFGIGPTLGTAGWAVPPSGVTFIGVWRSTGYASYDMFITSQGGGSSRGIELRSEAGAAKDQIVIDYTGSGIVFSNTAVYNAAVDNLHILRVGIPGSGAESWVNTSKTFGGQLPAAHGIAGNLWFGRRDDGYFANMHLGEAMVYEGGVSDSDLALLRTYLKDKWGTP